MLKSSVVVLVEYAQRLKDTNRFCFCFVRYKIYDCLERREPNFACRVCNVVLSERKRSVQNL